MIAAGSQWLASVSRVLCLGAHADDIEIGCGGTLLKILDQRQDLTIDWVVLSAEGMRADEARTSADRFLAPLPDRSIVVESFRERYFPYLGELKEYFDDLGTRCSPEVVFTHYRDDFHQDHRTVSELTWNTFRDHAILEYEVPKYDGDLGRPNAYVTLDKELGARKVEIILETFVSQARKTWLTPETLWSILRLRGVECRSPGGYAEAFHSRKLVLA